MNELTPHELNKIRMHMALVKDSIVEEYKKVNKDDSFSRKVINDYERIVAKLGRVTPE